MIGLFHTYFSHFTLDGMLNDQEIVSLRPLDSSNRDCSSKVIVRANIERVNSMSKRQSADVRSS